MSHAFAYAAGLFEGEGTITRLGKTSMRWQLAVSITDLEPLLKFKRSIGVGKIYGPYRYKGTDRRKRDHHKPYWRWTVFDRKSFKIAVQRMMRHLSERRKLVIKQALLEWRLVKTRQRARGGRP